MVNSFSIAASPRREGYYDYPLPGPFKARLSLKGVSAQDEIERLAAAPQGLRLLRQVHGVKVLDGRQGSVYPNRDSADGVIFTASCGPWALQFGDCSPVLLLCQGPEPWLAALHSGFRGTLDNITASAFEAASSMGLPVEPSAMMAWVGPAISGRCYSRSWNDPTTERALKAFCPEAQRRERDFVYFDIKAQIAHQLLQLGLGAERIWVERGCTCCDETLFYSHRRSTAACDPRMILTISI